MQAVTFYAPSILCDSGIDRSSRLLKNPAQCFDKLSMNGSPSCVTSHVYSATRVKACVQWRGSFWGRSARATRNEPRRTNLSSNRRAAVGIRTLAVGFGLLCASSVRPADAGTNVWTSNGPTGGFIHALAIDDPFAPTTVYAGTDGGGLFKTTDFGGTWNAVNSGLPIVGGTLEVLSLAVDPTAPTTVYAGAGLGVSKSTDAGASWSAADAGLPLGFVRALGVDPATPKTLYAGGGFGVFKTLNGGAGWGAVTSGLTNTDVHCLAINPATPAILYAGTRGGGVFKSLNGGSSWSAVNNGLANLVVQALAVDRATPTTIYAGTKGGVFKTTNAGASWTAANTGLTNVDIRSLATDPADATIVYAGTTGGGVFRSTNSGGTWSAVNSGLTNTVVLALAVDAFPASIYAGTEGGGIFKSANGASWVRSGLHASFVGLLAIDPTAPGTVYAATPYTGVLKSTNGGMSWSAINNGLSDPFVECLAIDPTAPSTLYAGTLGYGVFKTTNGGTSWSGVNNGIPTPFEEISDLAIDPVATSTLYVSIFGGGVFSGVFKSTNGGTDWSAANGGLTNLDVRQLAIDPAIPSTLYASTGAGIFKTTNGGTNWSAVNSGLTNNNVWPLAIDPATPAILYAGLGVGGVVFKTTNGGSSWSPVVGGLAGGWVFSLAIDPATSATVYAGTRGGGVFKSTNGGASWNPLNNGLSILDVFGLAIDPVTPSTVYAGTRGGGVFRIDQGTQCPNLAFVSDVTWDVYTVDPVANPTATPIGQAQHVCLTGTVPSSCPAGATIYGGSWTSAAWRADLSGIPGAHWIWAPNVSGTTTPADLKEYFFAKTFNLVGTPAGGTIAVAADDFAEVRVDGTVVGTVGSTSDFDVAFQAQGALQRFDITPLLHSGTNRIVIRAKNGPSSFSEGCGGACNYSQNAAGAVFGGLIAPTSAGVCRPATGPCDVAELCSGTSSNCPPDGFRSAGAGCDDGSACTTNDTCDGSGHCVGGAPPNCEDGNVCTSDSCNATSGCLHVPLTGTPCNDNNVCTTSDTCQNGTCVPGSLKDCLDANNCTTDSCDPVRDCQHSAPIAGCDVTKSKEGFVGGPNNTTCTNGTYDPNTRTCKLRSPNLDLTIPPGALTRPTNINIISTPANPTAGACDFALRNYLGKVVSCLQLEPSGQQFAIPVTAAFKWTNVASSACSPADCCVDAVDVNGATVLNEGTLKVYTQGKCQSTNTCEVTNTVCNTDADCLTPLTLDCGHNQPATPLCPVCPGFGCPGPTLDYATCRAPCTPPASCDPFFNTWIVQLSHFSQYAIAAVPPLPDHAQCYRSRVLSTTPVTVPVKLVDAFGTVSAAVIKPLKLCSPTNTNDEAPEALAHTDYLQSYGIRALNRRELDARLPIQGQKIVDQFGTHTLDLRLPDRLLLATAISFDSQPAAPSASSLDRFTCYKVRQTKGAPRFQPTDVTVTDPFNQSQATVRLKRPVRVCVPTNKDDQQPGAETNPWQLMCYRASPPFTQVRRLQTNNELGPSLVYPLLRDELCVPALKGS